MNPSPQTGPTDFDPHKDEQQLIAYHLGEPFQSLTDERALCQRLEHDPAFAALSEEIAHTLRVFSADPVPQPDTEDAWQRLRGTLPPLDTPQRFRRFRALVAWSKPGWLGLAPVAALCLLLISGLFAWHHHRTSTTTVDNAGVVHLRPSVGAATRAAEADHLDRAERWLTVVNHSTDPLDSTTRAEGQYLLTENAVYLRDARTRGDLPDAAVLDHLDRVLTTANHPSAGGLSLRLDMNTDGLLFQIRILRQNQTTPNGDSQ